MIILVTGVPGAGKTSFAVSELLRSDKRKLTFGCPVKGVEELQSPEFEDLNNCCILVDEAHFIFGSGMSKHVEFLTVHRHNNLDFILTTQDFSLLNRKILPLVGKHFHFSLTPLGERRMLQWDRYGNPRSKSDVASAQSKLVTVDRTNWGNFDSVSSGAEMPEVRKSQKPKIFFVVFALLVSLIFAVLYFGKFGTVKSYYNHEVSLPPHEVYLDSKEEPKLKPEFKLPELPGRDPIPEVKHFQEAKSASDLSDNVVGCVKSAESCNCYDEKARVLELPLDYCRKRFGT